jgi:hypothetical protein
VALSQQVLPPDDHQVNPALMANQKTSTPTVQVKTGVLFATACTTFK